MRHGKKFKHLNRKKGHRQFMLANLACSLIEHKRINTTLARAKALRSYVEPVITRSKEDSTHNRREAFKSLRNKNAVTELFRNISNKVSDRLGGYTRIIKLGSRLGDGAEMAMIELVDYNELYKLKGVASSEKKRTRRTIKKTTSAEAIESKSKATRILKEEANINSDLTQSNEPEEMKKNPTEESQAKPKEDQ